MGKVNRWRVFGWIGAWMFLAPAGAWLASMLSRTFFRGFDPTGVLIREQFAEARAEQAARRRERRAE